MNAHDSTFAYHQSTAIGASPVGQVVALYDTILRDLHRASVAIEAGQIEKRCNAINHALTVIGELQGVLDFERGGEPARHLNSFYNVTRAMVTHAGVMSSREELKELIGMFTRIRAAWSKTEDAVGPSEPPPEFRIASKPQAFASQNAPDTSEEGPSSSNGQWRA
jgi:flagellar protein FliS